VKTPPAIPGFTFEKKPYADLVTDFLAIPGWTAELLGLSTDGHEIYGFTYGDTANRPVMHVQGNVHGLHEWRTCYWVSKFMEYLHNPAGLASDTAAAIEDLKTRYSFSFIPACNPDGYVSNVYQNGNGVNLNRNFGDSAPAGAKWEWGPADPAHAQYRGPSAFSEVETQYIRDRVIALRPVSFMDTHTWSAERQGFTSLISRVAEHEPLVSEFHTELMKAVGMWPDGDAPHNLNESSGLAGNWGSATVSSQGKTPISITFESGGGWPVERQSHVGMTAILYHMLSVDAALAPPPSPLITGITRAWGPVMVNGLESPVTRVDVMQSGYLMPIWTAP
jgi:hypothetical protein